MSRTIKLYEDPKAVSPVIATIIMVAITGVLAGTLTTYVSTCIPGDYTFPQNTTLALQSNSSGNDRVVTILDVSGNGTFFINDLAVQILCSISFKVIVQYPTSGTGLGGGDGKHFEFNEVHNSSLVMAGDYFIIHLCDGIHDGDIFKILKGNETAGETQLS